MANLKALVPVAETVFKGCSKFPIAMGSVDPDDLSAAKRALSMGECAGSGSSKGRSVLAPNKSIDKIETICDDDENNIRKTKSVTRTGTFGFSVADNGEEVKRPTKIKFALDRIGFKDEQWEFVDPKISMYVVEAGRAKGVQVDSGVAAKHDGKYFVFDETVTMTQNLESVMPGSAIIFEFRHFKKDKKKMSTKCWAFIEREDLKEGSQVLELYKKPVDPRRKSLSLFTVKPLYLHLSVQLPKAS